MQVRKIRRTCNTGNFHEVNLVFKVLRIWNIKGVSIPKIKGYTKN